MSLLDEKPQPDSFFDRFTFKGLLNTCGVVFIVSGIVWVVSEFIFFTARDENGRIMAFINFDFAVFALTGFFLLLVGVASLMQRGREE